MTTRGGARIRVFHRLLLVVIALFALTAGLSQSVVASAAPRRSATVEPATKLTDEVVKVSWNGFRPTRSDGTFGVDILQCILHPKSVQRDCNAGETFPLSLTGNKQAGVTHRDGTGSVFMDIMSSARLPQLACSASHPCSVMLYETTVNGYDPTGLPQNPVIVPIHFERSQTDCPPVRRFDVRMETETSAAPALYEWATHFCTGKYSFTIDVTNSSSNQARADFLSNEIDMGVTSIPPEPSELKGRSRPFSAVPLDLTGIVLAYNITDPNTNKQITDLTLTPRLVARLLSDSDVDTFFEDPEFLKLNPHHAWPITAADPGIRGEQNADTWIVTNWIAGNKDANALLRGHDKYDIPVNPAWSNVHYPTDLFDARDPNGVYLPRLGEEGVALRLFAQTNPADSVPTDPLDAGQIGILDLPTAERFRLPIAKLTNGVGEPVVTVSPDSLNAGLAAMQTTPDGFHVEPATIADPNAYPLTKVDHAMVPKNLTGSAKSLRIRALLDYAVGPGQASLPLGYVQLPPWLQLQTLLYTGDLPPAPTTTTTMPPPSPPPVDYSSGSSTDYSTPTTTVTTPVTTPVKTVVHVKTKPQKRHTTLVALHLPDSGDRFALPILVVLALFALLACGADIAYRRIRR